MTESEPDVEEVKPIAGIGTKVFGKWDASEGPAETLVWHRTST